MTTRTRISAKTCSHFILTLLTVSGLFAQTQTFDKTTWQKEINTITTAAPFLLISPDSRAGGMGDAGVASSPDANSVYWNTSKLAFVEKQSGMSIAYTPWLRALVPDINLAYLSAYYKIKKDQVLTGSLRYFSLGEITFTDNTGNIIRPFKPNEFAIDAAYARKLSENFSGGMTIRYIYSNLTAGIPVAGAATKPGQSFAVDVSGYYQNKNIVISEKKSLLAFGLNISNVGAKMAYSNSGKRDFIPINMKLGSSLKIKLDDYNTFTFVGDLNKLLVPTPPVYKKTISGAPILDADGNQIIEKGKDPNRGVASGVFESFNDAPGGGKEELKEINYSLGIEYWYDQQFAIRTGYFHEDKTKGNREYFTMGIGLKYNVFGIDMAYLIPTTQRNPLQNTLRFTLMFDFDAFNSQNKSPATEVQ